MVKTLGTEEVADIFFGAEIVFLMKKDKEPDLDKIVAELKKHKKIKLAKKVELVEDKDGKFIL